MSARRDQSRGGGGKTPDQRAQGGSSSLDKGARITQLARTLGNDEIQKRLDQGNASRDQMLAHLCDRLEVMRELQTREVGLTKRGAHFWWWRLASDKQKPQYTTPEPTRWNEAARLYEEAAERLCQGDLKRGKEILGRAMDEEERVRSQLTELVDLRELGEGELDRSVLADISVTEVAGSCDEPSGVGVAREIQAVTTESPRVPNRSRPADPWWTLDEDEEEEEPGEGGGG